MNQYNTTGRLSAKAIIRTTGSGKKVAGFSLAIKTGYKAEDPTLFLECTAWEGLAETIENYTDKGTQIAISGELRPESWTAKDGTERKTITCTVKKVQLIGAKQEGKPPVNKKPKPRVDLPDLDDALEDVFLEDDFKGGAGSLGDNLPF